MANDLNMCIFIGRLGKDPDTRYQPSGAAVTNISIAVGKQWKDKQSGEKQERTTWVPVVAFGKLAEIMGEYLVSGAQVQITGELAIEKWQDNEGKDRWSTKIYASGMQMLGGKPSNQQSSQPQQGQQQSAPAQQQNNNSGFDDFDDPDIPF